MVAAGFSGGEADQLRRAMASWKKDGRIFEFKEKLITVEAIAVLSLPYFS